MSAHFFPLYRASFYPARPDLPPGITSVAGSGERSPTLPSHRRDFFSRFPIEIRSLRSVPIPKYTPMYTPSPRTLEIFEIIYFDIEKNRCKIFLKILRD